MNWKYNNTMEDESAELGSGALQALLAASYSGSSGGNSIRTVENTIYFYGDITESNALDLNSTLHAVDKKLQL